jgi:hypothetical protein
VTQWQRKDWEENRCTEIKGDKDRTHIRVCVCVCAYELIYCMYVCMYVCVYVYIYIYTQHTIILG